MAKRLGEIISRSEEEEEEEGIPMTPAPHDSSLPCLLRGSSANEGLPFLSTKPPGKILFTQPPSFLTELYPPGLDTVSEQPLDDLLSQDNPLILRGAIVTGLLSLCFRDRPCPSAVWAWLFHLMCRSHDSIVCKASLKTLNDLVLTAKQHNFVIWCPPVLDIQDALIGLGANREMVLNDLAYRDLDVDGTNNVFVLAPPPGQVSHLRLTCLVRFMNTCVHGLVSYILEELHTLIVLLVKVSLDPAVCGTVQLNGHISLCIGTLLEIIPEENWPLSHAQLCAKLESLSTLHYNHLHIAQVISTISGRQEQLVRLYVKHCIGHCTGGDTTLEDVDFVRNVIMCYYKSKSSQHDYFQMFSVLKMLNLYLPPSKMKWASADNKQQFGRLLALFASQLLDRVSLNLEAAVIKNYLADIKMELDSQIVPDGPRQQTLAF